MMVRTNIILRPQPFDVRTQLLKLEEHLRELKCKWPQPQLEALPRTRALRGFS